MQAFANGQEAIEAIAKDARPIALLLTDYDMPGLTGYELAQRVQIERPEMPILIASGMDPDWIFAQVGPTVRSAFIQKPYSLKKLARTVRELLNGTPSGLESVSGVSRCAS